LIRVNNEDSTIDEQVRFVLHEVELWYRTKEKVPYRTSSEKEDKLEEQPPTVS